MAAAVLQTASVAALSQTSFLGNTKGRLSRSAVPAFSLRARAAVKVQAAKGEWFPGLASPPYLDGSLPGDNGFDPLGLGEDPENLKWYVQAELQNGRWAMLGVSGALVPEILTKAGVIDVPVWYDAGKAEYFAPWTTLLFIQFLLFHYVEVRRWQDIKYPGSVNEDPIFKGNKLPAGEVGYPDGIFNPLNFAPSLDAKEKELANARLAMVAFFGFVIQCRITGAGPFANLLQHLSDPWHNTVFQSLDAFFKTH
jgi:light-harvesting complex I chlorophyll a/b binding protein 4